MNIPTNCRRYGWFRRVFGSHHFAPFKFLGDRLVLRFHRSSETQVLNAVLVAAVHELEDILTKLTHSQNLKHLRSSIHDATCTRKNLEKFHLVMHVWFQAIANFHHCPSCLKKMMIALNVVRSDNKLTSTFVSLNPQHTLCKKFTNYT